MKSTIKDILHGLKGHKESMVMPKDNNESMGIVCDTYTQLQEKLSPELLNLHQQLVDALEDNWADETDFYFVEGFKLGALIILECIGK